MSLGANLAKVDARNKVTGEALYAGDLADDDMLHALVVFTDQVHARLTHLDVSAAQAMPGVHLVLTSADVPVNEYGLTKFDQPVLIGTESTGRSSVPHDVSRWEADHLAVVVADTPEIAAAAADLIETTWVALPIVHDIDEALADDAVLLHPEDASGSNEYSHLVIRKGDVDRAFADAEHIIEGTYEFPHQEHAFLQTDAAVASIDNQGRVTVETAGQWTHEDQMQVAHALGVDNDEVRIIYRAIGGAFGGKEDMSLQVVLGLAAARLRDLGIRRPVKCTWSREESIVGHHKRHRGRVTTRWAATADGRVLGVEAECHLDAGAYNLSLIHISEPTRPPLLSRMPSSA